MNNYEKSDLISLINAKFINEFNLMTYDHEKDILNYGCSNDDTTSIIIIGDIIKNNTEFYNLGLYDIYTVIIYIIYSLRLNEQTTDWLFSNFLKKTTYNKNDSEKLYFDITIGDIMIDNFNLSSKIRKYIMGMNET
jgi:hypothetical protein